MNKDEKAGRKIWIHDIILRVITRNARECHVLVTIQMYKIPISNIVSFFLLGNFAIVGTIAIFFPKGIIPTYITQSYLVPST